MIRWMPFAAVKEQFQGIQELYDKQYDVPMPELDQQRFEELNDILCEVLVNNFRVNLYFHKNQRIEKCTGHIHYFDTLAKELRIVTKSEHMLRIKIATVISIEIE